MTKGKIREREKNLKSRKISLHTIRKPLKGSCIVSVKANVVDEPGPLNSTSLDVDVKNVPGTSANRRSIEVQIEARSS
jgi:hypothetical protein